MATATTKTQTQDATLETLRAQYPASPTLITYVAAAHAAIKALERRVKELEAAQQREESFWMRYHYGTDVPGWEG